MSRRELSEVAETQRARLHALALTPYDEIFLDCGKHYLPVLLPWLQREFAAERIFFTRNSRGSVHRASTLKKWILSPDAT